MKKIILLLGMCLLLMPSVLGSICAQAEAGNIISYLTMDGIATDETGFTAYTNDGADSDVVALANLSYAFIAANTDHLSADANLVDTALTWCFGITPALTIAPEGDTTGRFFTEVGGTAPFMGLGKASGSFTDELFFIYDDTSNYQYWTDTQLGIANFPANEWYYVCLVWDGASRWDLYLNNSDKGSGTVLGTSPSLASLRPDFGKYGAAGYFGGKLDEILFSNVSFTTIDLTQLFANVTIENQYDDWKTCAGAPGPGDYTYVKIEAEDKYNSSSLGAGYNVTLSDGLSNLTNAAGMARFNHTGNVAYNITDPTTSYFFFESTVNAAPNVTTTANLTGAFPTFTVFDVDGTALSNFTITSPSTSNTTAGANFKLLLPPNGTIELEGAVTGYFNVSKNITTTGQDSGAYNISGFYQAVLTINATNAFTGALLSNFSGWVYHNETAYNESFSTTGNNISLNVLFGNYTVYLDVFGYSLSAANFKQQEINETNETITFNLYSENSINILIRDEDTNLLINGSTTTVETTGNGTFQSNTTENGTLILEDLLDGNYSIQFENLNYTTRSYTVTVAGRSTQTLNAYLTPAANKVVFGVIDDSSGQTIEDVNVIMERLLNGSFVVVENRDTDVTGRVQFSFSTGVLYRFTLSKSNYTSRVFELDPIIFESYIIRLVSNLLVDEEIGLFDVTINYFTDHTPKWFLNNDNTSFTLTFGSAGGSLETYGYRIVYPGGNNESAGSNSIGETFLSTFPIVGAASTDRVNLTYWYDSVLGDNKTYSRSWIIEGAADNGTLYNAKEEDFGLGTLEKILIAVVVTLLVAGLLTLTAGPLFGLAGGILIVGFFTYIGFLSIWVSIPTFFVGMLLFMGRSDQ